MKTKLVFIVFCLLIGACGQTWGLQTRENQTPKSANTTWQPVLKDPQIIHIQNTMNRRYRSILKEALDKHTIGVDRVGFVQVLPHTKPNLTLEKAVREENRSRKELYKLISVKQNHPEWEKSIQTVFAEQWLEKARKNNWVVITSGVS